MQVFCVGQATQQWLPLVADFPLGGAAEQACDAKAERDGDGAATLASDDGKATGGPSSSPLDGSVMAHQRGGATVAHIGEGAAVSASDFGRGTKKGVVKNASKTADLVESKFQSGGKGGAFGRNVFRIVNEAMSQCKTADLVESKFQSGGKGGAFGRSVSVL